MKRTINKTQFILQYPKLPAADVVAKAKQKGFKLSEKYVYNIRAKAKAQGGKPRKPGRPPSKVNGSPGARGKQQSLSDSSNNEQAFFDLVLALGLTRSGELIDKVRETAAAL